MTPFVNNNTGPPPGYVPVRTTYVPGGGPVGPLFVPSDAPVYSSYTGKLLGFGPPCEGTPSDGPNGGYFKYVKHNPDTKTFGASGYGGG
jgi:hypothetical protein